jgi:glycosyltransferase involved in cell wall biosynthesis
MSTPDSALERIIHVAPPYVAVSTEIGYGGSERVLLGLLKQQLASTIPVSLYATGDSQRAICHNGNQLNVNLIPYMKRACGLEKFAGAAERALMGVLYDVMGQLTNNPNTIAHAHVEDRHLPIAKTVGVQRRVVTTMHNLPKDFTYQYHLDAPMVFISRAQANEANYQCFDCAEVIYNGIDPALFLPNYQPSSDAPLVFLGRFSPEKGADKAVQAALATGNRLKIAARIEEEHRAYYESKVLPLIQANPEQIEYVGEVNDVLDTNGLSSKSRLLREAKALLFPINWKEPFGLVMVEAMLAGTPVIALNHPGSSVEEIIEDGVNGYKAHTMDQLIQNIDYIPNINRRGVRENAVNRFSSEVMAANYLKFYERVLEYSRS